METKQKVSWLETSTFLVVVIEGMRPFNIEVGSEKYKKIMRLIKRNKTDKIAEVLKETKEIEKFTQKDVKINRMAETTWKGKHLPEGLTSMIEKYKNEGLEYKPLEKFLTNLSKNPNEDSQRDLFSFLKHNDCTLTSDGCFLASKKVKTKNGHLVDFHSEKFNNDPGQVVEMPREKVDSNRDVSCSTGLHVAADEYARDFSGDTLITVKVDPRDVCAVPRDYNRQKMRVCRYRVIAKGAMSYPDAYIPWVEDMVKKQNKKGKVSIVLPENATSMSIDFDLLSGRQIIKAIKKATGVDIKVSHKSKKSVIRHAKAILEKHADKVINLSKMTGAEIIKKIKEDCGKTIECSTKSKKTIVKRAKKILDEKGIPYID